MLWLYWFNVYRTLLFSLLSILCFWGVEVPEVLFGVEQGWETNREINYQLINSRGVKKSVFKFFTKQLLFFFKLTFWVFNAFLSSSNAIPNWPFWMCPMHNTSFSSCFYHFVLIWALPSNLGSRSFGRFISRTYVIFNVLTRGIKFSFPIRACLRLCLINIPLKKKRKVYF